MSDKLVIMLLTLDPERPHVCGTPFFQAAAAAAMDVQVEMFFASRATLLLRRGVAEQLYPSDNRARSVYGFMQEAHALGVKFFACGGALEAFGMTLNDLVAECSGVANATTFVSRVVDDEWKSISY